MPESLVLELQRLASSPEERLPDLLRKALIVATKLGLDDFRVWIEQELEGYCHDTKPPAYRHIKCALCAHNKYCGHKSVGFPDSELLDKYSAVPVRQSVQSIEAIIEMHRSNGYVEYTLPQTLETTLRKRCDYDGYSLSRNIGINDLVGILDTVRTKVLQWALKLEHEGILGEGMSFSSEEKQKAQASQFINIENFSGIWGPVSGGQISQNIQTQINKNDFSSLATALAELDIDQEDIDHLKDALKDDPAPQQADKFGPKVGKWVGTMMQKAAEGKCKILLDVAGKVLSEALLKYYGLKQ